jgi:acetamidase/formamidase
VKPTPESTRALNAGSRWSRHLLLTLVAAVSGAPGQAQRVHHLPATPQTVAYGHYWSEAKPVLTIASGDVIDVETLLTSVPSRLEAAGVPPGEIQQSLRDIVSQVTDRGPGGHILTGPVYVEGADSGDVLEVRVRSIDLAIPYGYNGCSGFVRELCDRSGQTMRIIRLDRRRMTGQFAPGIDVPLGPFFGSMGVAPPPARGRVSSNPPDIHAGNLDNKELVAGTTLYIPIHVKGALFEVGDGHAAQGDGEVDQTAIETSLRGRLQLIVRKDMKLEWPRGETPTHWITMGMDTSLVRSTRIAVEQMVKFLTEVRGLDQMSAYQLASIAADLRITQLVDGNVGVHMMFPKALLGTGAPPRRDD